MRHFPLPFCLQRTFRFGLTTLQGFSSHEVVVPTTNSADPNDLLT